MAEDYGDPEADQLSRTWTRGCNKTKSRQRMCGTKSPLLDSAEYDERYLGIMTVSTA